MQSTDQFQNVRTAFSKQSSSFDGIEDQNEILKWMRLQIHNHCMKFYKTGDEILELNCGTGIDAVFFAEQGMKVHATDLSEGMLNELKKKVEKKNLQERITIQQCSFTELEKVEKKNFDHLFSDFGGLNCVKEIDQVIKQFKNLLKPGGTVTLVIMPPVCPWEILLALKGNFKTAFRRFKKNGSDSHLEGFYFDAYYFSASKLISYFGKSYRKIELRGLASFVPPPYLENFPVKHPVLFKMLAQLDETCNGYFPFNRWADHFILSMQSKK